MTEQQNLTLNEATNLMVTALIASNTAPAIAQSVTTALLHAEMDGQKGHGFSRIPSYCGQAKSGKVDGSALPDINHNAPSVLSVNANHGFAYPVFDRLVEILPDLVEKQGIVATRIFRSHHFGQAGYHVERLANKGCIALLFGNTPKAIAPWGGQTGIFGTNPIAFATPVAHHDPLVIDLSLSKVARGKIMAASQKGEQIEEGLAFDEKGNPTTDAHKALKGTMAPMGDAKGAALALMVEILSAGLSGAQFGYEAGSFFTPDGKPPSVGHLLITFAPSAFGGPAYGKRIAELCNTILSQDRTRLPGQSKARLRAEAKRTGLKIDTPLLQEIRSLAGISE